MISFQFKFKHNAPIVDCYICYCEWKEAFIHCAKASGPNLISFVVACSSFRWLPILVNWAAVTSPNPAPHLKGARDVYLGKSQLITNGAVTEHHHQVYSGWMGGNRCEFSIHSSFGQSEMNAQWIMLLFSEMIVITCFHFSLAQILQHYYKLFVGWLLYVMMLSSTVGLFVRSPLWEAACHRRVSHHYVDLIVSRLFPYLPSERSLWGS